MQPANFHGVEVQSIGFLVKPEQAQIWRGPMASQTLLQLIQETKWSALDVLLLDMPPGTGDIQLSMSQKVNLTGAIIVTTPQNIATADAKKGITMFRKVHVPVLGVIENMSYHQCTSCGNIDTIFGEDGGETIAQEAQVPLLGRLPLHQSIRKDADQGCPTVIKDVSSNFSVNYRDIAKRAITYLNQRPLPKSVFIDITDK